MTRSRARPAQLLVLAVVASLIAPISLASPALAAGPVIGGVDVTVPTGNRISGTVKNSGAVAIAGMSVIACTLDQDCVSDAVTAANGTFTIRGLLPDVYALFLAPNDGLNYLAAWYSSTGPVDDIVDATSIDVTAGNQSGVNATVDTGLTISGTVTGAGAGGLTDVQVSASGQDGSGSAVTDVNGHYTIKGLRDGIYSLMIRVPATLNFRSGSVVNGGVIQDESAGTPIDLGGTNATGVNVVAPAGRRISGMLSGSEVVGAGVSAFGTSYSDQAAVAANGQWSINGLWPGTYHVVFSASQVNDDDNLFPLGYWSGTSTLTANPDAAADIVVTGSNIGPLNSAIPAGLTISGTVSDENGVPLSDAFVSACGSTVGCASRFTDGTGKWAFRHLRPDSFLISVGHREHVGGFFGSGGFAVDETRAKRIALSTASVAGVDLVLPSGATITGHLRGPLAEAIPNAYVRALGSGGLSEASPGFDLTSSDGSFVLRGLDEDAYRVSVSFGANSDYLRGYFDDSSPDGYTDDYDLATIIEINDAAVGTSYLPIDPKRVVDSRIALGVSGAFAANVPRTFQVAGVSSIPLGAIAVTGNVTVVGQSAGGYVSLGPVATANPKSSTINFPLGDTRANNFIVPVASNGKLSAVYKAPAGKSAHVIVDITGYYLAGDTHGTWSPLAPTRVLDTRVAKGLSGPFAANAPRTLSIAGANGIPADATAITGNLTVVGQTRAGYLSITPTNTANPTTSTLNFPLGDTRANGVTSRLNGSGDVWIVYKASGGTTNVILDVTGYYRNSPTGMLYYPLSPARLIDTRPGVLASELVGALIANTPRSAQPIGRARIPLAARAVTGNVTVVGQTAAGYVSITPDPTTTPATSTINFPLGDTRANGLIAPLNGPGRLSIVYKAPGGKQSQVILDITGYFR